MMFTIHQKRFSFLKKSFISFFTNGANRPRVNRPVRKIALERIVPGGTGFGANRPVTVHVWAGISHGGATDIHIFTGIMDSTYYQSILKNYLVPFIQTVYPESHRFMQDNDPKHVSRSTIQFMNDENINYWPTPPESPDLNPIENLWAGLKRYIRKTKKPRNKQQLIEGIKESWRDHVTPELCNKYINHLMNVLPIVIKKNGAATGK